VNTAEISRPVLRKPLRLWLPILALTLWLLRFIVPLLLPDAILFGMLGSLVGAAGLVIWWAFFSRAPWPERWGAVLLMIACLFVTSRFIDKSIATGMMGFMFPSYSIPVVGAAFAVWATFGQRLSDSPRRLSMVATIVVACGGWTLLRTNGISGEAVSDFAWRWSKTREQRLLAQEPLPAIPPSMLPVTIATGSAPARIPAERTPVHAEDAPAPKPLAAETGVYWPGFRGPGRDSVVPGTRINADWSAAPPVQLWRRPVGPGWGSFAVQGDRLYTQEQRGDDEIVGCYSAATGEPVWVHRDAARFWESNAGAGPRATPTLHDVRVYAFGATGIVNALNASDGTVLWSRNAVADTGTKVPGWGFASSPLVFRDMVIVAASGRLVAYDAASGAPRWLGPSNGNGYSSPHLETIDGVAQILLMSSFGVTSVAPSDGSLLWKYAWESDTRIMQPAMTADGDLLMSVGDAMGGGGLRRIAISHAAAGWATEERWTSTGLKPSFNDFVVHDGDVFGFDGGILACIDAKDGKRKWKGGRYGHGQLILLRDQGLLLVLSEEGELALVKAASDQFTEIAHFAAIEGKTWNHPVLAGDRLFVRNGDEMAALRLSSASR